MGEPVQVIDDVAFEDLLDNPYPIFKNARNLGPVAAVEAGLVIPFRRRHGFRAVSR